MKINNKSIVQIICLALCLITMFSCNNTKPSISPNNKDVVIFATNDVHSSYDEKLGYAGLKYFIDHFDKNENDTILIDTGNFSVGCDAAYNSKGKATIEIMKAVGYDFVVPGCYEFYYGYDVFLENMKKFGDKVLSCNILDIKTNKLLFNPYKIIKLGNFNVALIGVTTPETLYRCDESIFIDENGNDILYFYGDESGKSLYAQIQKYVDKAKKEGADKVILVGNLGDANVITQWTSTEVIKNTTDIDAVIDGHSMELLDNGLMTNKVGSFVPIVQAESDLAYIAVMNITKDGYTFPALLSEKSVINKDEKITELISKLREKYKGNTD